MAIHFDGIPGSNPANGAKPVGYYKALIAKAEMRQPKDADKPPYLALTYDLTGPDNKGAGKLWDNFFDINKELPRYKIGRLIAATQIEINAPSFELKDLAKILPGKQMVITLGVEKDDPNRNTIDVFKGEIYYPVSKWAELTGQTSADDDFPFTGPTTGPIAAPDAAPSEY